MLFMSLHAPRLSVRFDAMHATKSMAQNRERFNVAVLVRVRG